MTGVSVQFYDLTMRAQQAITDSRNAESPLMKRMKLVAAIDDLRDALKLLPMPQSTVALTPERIRYLNANRFNETDWMENSDADC